MKVLVDNNISPRLAKALSELEGPHGVQVVHLKDKFSPNTPDVEWMSALGEEGGWCVLTCDVRISRNPDEVKAWLESGLIVFFLKKPWLKQTFWVQAAELVKRWPMIQEAASKALPGSGFIVSTKIEKLN